MNFDSQVTKESQALQGVSFTIRVLNKIQRAKRDLPLVDARARLTQLFEQVKAIENSELDEDRLKRASMDHESGVVIDLHFKPAFIRAGLISIEGLNIDGSPATADSLINSGSQQLDLLIDEIYVACATESGLSEEQKKTLSSASPSFEATATEGQTMIADAA